MAIPQSKETDGSGAAEHQQAERCPGKVCTTLTEARRKAAECSAKHLARLRIKRDRWPRILWAPSPALSGPTSSLAQLFSSGIPDCNLPQTDLRLFQ